MSLPKAPLISTFIVSAFTSSLRAAILLFLPFNIYDVSIMTNCAFFVTLRKNFP